MKDPEQQFLRAYDQFADAIFRHCYFRVSNPELAKDLMQETFVRTWRYITQGKVVENMRAFLYRTANNLIIDQYRKKKELSLEGLQEKGASFSSKDRQYININAANDALKMLERLRPGYKEIIIMRYIDELSPKEIARILGETENNVYVKIHRALEDLRKILNENN